MNNNNSQRIKSLLTYQISIKSLNTYKRFLIRRPKKAQTLKFSARQSVTRSPWNLLKKVQLRLFKALELARPIRKIDLSKYMLDPGYLRKYKWLFTLKRNSPVKIVYLYRFFVNSLEQNFSEKGLRYLKEIQYLSFRMAYFHSRFMQYYSYEYPLKYLRYCSKLQKLQLGDPWRCYCFKKISIRPRKKGLAIHHLLLDRKLSSSFTESLNELVSLFFDISDFGPQKDVLDFIQDLPNLQEISLKFGTYVSSDDLKGPFQKMTENGNLRKIKLELRNDLSKFDEVLEALNHSKMTYFSLKAPRTVQRRSLASLTALLQTTEDLRLDLPSQGYFSSETVSYDEICKEITKLEKLQHLKLAFNAPQRVPKEQRLENFLPSLYPVFAKPIKLHTLSLSCNQIDHSEALPDLITNLQSLSASLCKLKIDLGVPTLHPELHKIIADLIKNLCSIKVLKLPCVLINSSESLNLIGEAVQGLKYLEVFVFGKIRKKVDVSLFLKFIGNILCKRGLRKFHCKMAEGLREKVFKDISSFKEHYDDLKKITKENPYLEDVLLSSYDRERRFTSEILKWHEEERSYRHILLDL